MVRPASRNPDRQAVAAAARDSQATITDRGTVHGGVDVHRGTHLGGSDAGQPPAAGPGEDGFGAFQRTKHGLPPRWRRPIDGAADRQGMPGQGAGTGGVPDHAPDHADR